MSQIQALNSPCSVHLALLGLSSPQGLPVSSAFFLLLVLWLVPTFGVPISWGWGCLPRMGHEFALHPVLYLDLIQRMCCE